MYIPREWTGNKNNDLHNIQFINCITPTRLVSSQSSDNNTVLRVVYYYKSINIMKSNSCTSDKYDCWRSELTTCECY